MDATEIVCNDIINNHPWDCKYKVDLADISNRDYPGKDYFPRGVCALDIDIYERNNSHSPQKTMDSAVGICNYDGCRYVSKRLSLVELRLNYTNINNVSYSDLHEKVTHTKDLLVGNALDSVAYFVFSDSLAPPVKNLFNRWAKADKSGVKDWLSIGVSEYVKTRMRTTEDVAYQPRHDISALKSDLAYLSSNEDALFYRLCEWERIINQEKKRYNLKEAIAIRDAILEKMPDIVNSLEEQVTRDLITIYLEDIKRL